MKKSCLPILTIFLIILFIAGCTKEPINNEIEGFWILREFTTLEDGKITRCNRLYYSITRMVTEISEKQGNNNYGSYIGKTKYGEEEKQLILTDFKIRQSTSDSGNGCPRGKIKKVRYKQPRNNYFQHHILQWKKNDLAIKLCYTGTRKILNTQNYLKPCRYRYKQYNIIDNNQQNV